MLSPLSAAMQRGSLALIGATVAVSVALVVANVAANGADVVHLCDAGALVAVVAAVAVGREQPRWGGAIMATVPLVQIAGTLPPPSYYSIAAFVAFYLALRSPVAIFAGAVIATSSLLGVGVRLGTVNPADAVDASISAFAVVAAAALGASIRGRDAALVEMAGRVGAAERAAASEAERGIARERLRIARDLHDSVGHHIAVINLHLGAAEVILDDSPDSAKAQLAQARVSIQEVLRDMQDILRVLREDGSAASAAHGASVDISGLVATCRATGAEVFAQLDPLDGLPPSIQRAAYRVVQEALTNAQRYADGEVTLLVRIEGDDRLEIEVANVIAGDAARPAGLSGSGIAGMRARMESVGGELAVNNNGSVFAIRASVPVEKVES